MSRNTTPRKSTPPPPKYDIDLDAMKFDDWIILGMMATQDATIGQAFSVLNRLVRGGILEYRLGDLDDISLAVAQAMEERRADLAEGNYKLDASFVDELNRLAGKLD